MFIYIDIQICTLYIIIIIINTVVVYLSRSVSVFRIIPPHLVFRSSQHGVSV